jgi:hypothetical protein
MKNKFMSTVMIKTILIITLFSTLFSCKKECIPETGPYDLDVVLRGETKTHPSVGFIKFRQDPDPAQIITLDTWVSNLAPNHSYLLQRAVNPITDNTCTSTAWLTLGEGLQPLAIQTNDKGDGSANLWRDVSAVARGTSFNIHFQVVDAITLSPVLTSDCYQYTVR